MSCFFPDAPRARTATVPCSAVGDAYDGLLVKPFSLDALRATVARVVSAR